MKVYQIQPGAGLDGLSLDERSEPMPAPGQVLIKVKAVSLNDRDLLILKGLYPGVIEPVIPVSDGVGEVVALGEGVMRAVCGRHRLARLDKRGRVCAGRDGSCAGNGQRVSVRHAVRQGRR